MFLYPMSETKVIMVTMTTLISEFGGIWSAIGICFVVISLYLDECLYDEIAVKIYEEKKQQNEPHDGASPEHSHEES